MIAEDVLDRPESFKCKEKIAPKTTEPSDGKCQGPTCPKIADECCRTVVSRTGIKVQIKVCIDKGSKGEPVSEVMSCADHVNVGDLIVTLGRVLTKWMEASTAQAADKGSGFDIARPPAVPLVAYLELIHKYCHCSSECLVIALTYIDRISKFDPAVQVSKFNVHRLLAVAAMVATKFHNDNYHANGHYAKVAGLRVKEMNVLEARFLKIMHWNAFVEPRVFEIYQSLLDDLAWKDLFDNLAVFLDDLEPSQVQLCK